MAEETTDFSPVLFFGIVIAVFINECYSVMSLLS